ncbi:hypothetical protein PHAVU_005G001800 [Phaseolus vulgaris]|uniref:RING-type domain-containing protein n=1 Tax=Phaseolus vulgaris TaxID=3885 RepID=V7BVM6_PHAVU|nr:hypothetical protein PHAVU_005G001800g [Phaseolus vulgaris]ESW20616.1 hypothetical protein PHAVU_005G001800g [Phaseolus vulgaris]
MEAAPPSNDLCSVCHGNFHLPCQANCSHWFCANCIMLVWQHGSGTSSCKCPLCRRPITLLVPTEHSLRQRHDPEVAQILSKIHAYNRVFGGQPSSFFQALAGVPRPSQIPSSCRPCPCLYCYDSKFSIHPQPN